MAKTRVAAMLGIAFTSGCAVTPPPPRTGFTPPVPVEQRGVHSGVKQQIWWTTTLNPKCELVGYPEFIIAASPHHGSVVTEHGEQYPGFPQTNDRSVCNSRLVPATNLYYQSNPDFHGKDSLTMKVLTADGTVKTVHIEIEVF